MWTYLLKNFLIKTKLGLVLDTLFLFLKKADDIVSTNF